MVVCLRFVCCGHLTMNLFIYSVRTINVAIRLSIVGQCKLVEKIFKKQRKKWTIRWFVGHSWISAFLTPKTFHSHSRNVINLIKLSFQHPELLEFRFAIVIVIIIIACWNASRVAYDTKSSIFKVVFLVLKEVMLSEGNKQSIYCKIQWWFLIFVETVSFISLNWVIFNMNGHNHRQIQRIRPRIYVSSATFSYLFW